MRGLGDLPSGVRGDYEDHSQKVMQNHDEEVLAPRVHENGRVERVHVEAAFDEVEETNLVGHAHAQLPIF